VAGSPKLDRADLRAVWRVLVLLLVAANGFFVATEFALVSSRWSAETISR